MAVRADMLNGHAICHGGFIFTLADSAFAYACNSYNLTTVASGCTIDFLAPAREGELQRSALDNTKAGRLWGWRPEVTLEEGLRRTVEWQRRRMLHASESRFPAS